MDGPTPADKALAKARRIPAEFSMRKHLGSLRPADHDAEEALRRMPANALVMVKVKRPRNIQHHRKLFTLLNIVVENQEHYQTTEHLLAVLKVVAGHCDTYPMADGNTAFVPRSISFASMDQTEFEEFYDKAVKFIVTKVIPGLKREDLEREVLEMIS